MGVALVKQGSGDGDPRSALREAIAARTVIHAKAELHQQAIHRARNMVRDAEAKLEHVPPELNSVGFPGRSGWQILSALIRFWERERCRRPTLLIFEVE